MTSIVEQVDAEPGSPTDDEMRASLAESQPFVAVLLSKGPRYDSEGAPAVIWEHGRRNFRLRQHKFLRIVLPITDDSDLCGVGIFDASLDDVRDLMDSDPGVTAGLFTYTAHSARSFPDDSLSDLPERLAP